MKEAAIVVEEAGATVIGSITDNHKINQQYCKLFKRPPGFDCPATGSFEDVKTLYEVERESILKTTPL